MKHSKKQLRLKSQLSCSIWTIKHKFVDFWFNNLTFLLLNSDHFGHALSKHTSMLESLRSILATYKGACLLQGTGPCQGFYMFCEFFQTRVRRINQFTKLKAEVQGKVKKPKIIRAVLQHHINDRPFGMSNNNNCISGWVRSRKDHQTESVSEGVFSL